MATRRWIRDPLALAVSALASYRLTRLMTTDHLPPAEKARTWLEERTPGNYAVLWTCPWCFSFWTSAAIVAVGEIAERKGRRNTFLLALMPWALSTVAGMIAEREIG
jgi:hypothetical protein